MSNRVVGACCPLSRFLNLEFLRDAIVGEYRRRDFGSKDNGPSVDAFTNDQDLIDAAQLLGRMYLASIKLIPTLLNAGIIDGRFSRLPDRIRDVCTHYMSQWIIDKPGLFDKGVIDVGCEVQNKSATLCSIVLRYLHHWNLILVFCCTMN